MIRAAAPGTAASSSSGDSPSATSTSWPACRSRCQPRLGDLLGDQDPGHVGASAADELGRGGSTPFDQSVVAQGVGEPGIPGAPKASPGTKATLASSSTNSANSSGGRRPRRPRRADGPGRPRSSGRRRTRPPARGQRHAGDVVEHGHDRLPAPVVGLPHLGHGGRSPADRGQGRPLGHVADVGGGVGLQVGGRRDDVGRADHPAHPPAGHGVGLGHPVDDHAGDRPARAPPPAST